MTVRLLNIDTGKITTHDNQNVARIAYTAQKNRVPGRWDRVMGLGSHRTVLEHGFEGELNAVIWNVEDDRLAEEKYGVVLSC